MIMRLVKTPTLSSRVQVFLHPILSHPETPLHPLILSQTTKCDMVSPLPTCGPSLGSGLYLGF